MNKREVLDSSYFHRPQGIVFGSRLDFTPIFIKGAVETITGYKESDFLAGKPRWEEIVHPDDRLALMERAACLRTTANGAIQHEYRIICQEKQVRWVRGFIQNISDATGKPTFLEGAIFDITQHKKAEEELLRAQKLQSLRVLAAGMAHDFNNLLTVIVGGLSLAQTDRTLSEKTSQILKEAEKACQCAVRLTQQLIDTSSGGNAVGRTESLREILDAAVQRGLTGSHMPCCVVADEDLWPVICDAKQVQRALENVILNAKEAIHNGGFIQVTANNVRLEEGQVPLLRGGNYVRVSVKDTGSGISEDHLPCVFDPYFSTKKRGTDKGMGLGLTTTYSILRRHEGHIQVESKVGVGSTAHMYFPAYRESV